MKTDRLFLGFSTNRKGKGTSKPAEGERKSPEELSRSLEDIVKQMEEGKRSEAMKELDSLGHVLSVWEPKKEGELFPGVALTHAVDLAILCVDRLHTIPVSLVSSIEKLNKHSCFDPQSLVIAPHGRLAILMRKASDEPSAVPGALQILSCFLQSSDHAVSAVCEHLPIDTLFDLFQAAATALLQSNLNKPKERESALFSATALALFFHIGERLARFQDKIAELLADKILDKKGRQLLFDCLNRFNIFSTPKYDDDDRDRPTLLSEPSAPVPPPSFSVPAAAESTLLGACATVCVRFLDALSVTFQGRALLLSGDRTLSVLLGTLRRSEETGELEWREAGSAAGHLMCTLSGSPGFAACFEKLVTTHRGALIEAGLQEISLAFEDVEVSEDPIETPHLEVLLNLLKAPDLSPSLLRDLSDLSLAALLKDLLVRAAESVAGGGGASAAGAGGSRRGSRETAGGLRLSVPPLVALASSAVDGICCLLPVPKEDAGDEFVRTLDRRGVQSSSLSPTRKGAGSRGTEEPAAFSKEDLVTLGAAECVHSTVALADHFVHLEKQRHVNKETASAIRYKVSRVLFALALEVPDRDLLRWISVAPMQQSHSGFGGGRRMCSFLIQQMVASGRPEVVRWGLDVVAMLLRVLDPASALEWISAAKQADRQASLTSSEGDTKAEQEGGGARGGTVKGGSPQRKGSKSKGKEGGAKVPASASSNTARRGSGAGSPTYTSRRPSGAGSPTIGAVSPTGTGRRRSSGGPKSPTATPTARGLADSPSAAAQPGKGGAAVVEGQRGGVVKGGGSVLLEKLPELLCHQFDAVRARATVVALSLWITGVSAAASWNPDSLSAVCVSTPIPAASSSEKEKTSPDPHTDILTTLQSLILLVPSAAAKGRRGSLASNSAGRLNSSASLGSTEGRRPSVCGSPGGESQSGKGEGRAAEEMEGGESLSGALVAILHLQVSSDGTSQSLYSKLLHRSLKLLIDLSRVVREKREKEEEQKGGKEKKAEGGGAGGSPTLFWLDTRVAMTVLRLAARVTLLEEDLARWMVNEVAALWANAVRGEGERDSDRVVRSIMALLYDLFDLFWNESARVSSTGKGKSEEWREEVAERCKRLTMRAALSPQSVRAFVDVGLVRRLLGALFHRFGEFHSDSSIGSGGGDEGSSLELPECLADFGLLFCSLVFRVLYRSDQNTERSAQGVFSLWKYQLNPQHERVALSLAPLLDTLRGANPNARRQARSLFGSLNSSSSAPAPWVTAEGGGGMFRFPCREESGKEVLEGQGSKLKGGGGSDRLPPLSMRLADGKGAKLLSLDKAAVETQLLPSLPVLSLSSKGESVAEALLLLSSRALSLRPLTNVSDPGVGTEDECESGWWGRGGRFSEASGGGDGRDEDRKAEVRSLLLSAYDFGKRSLISLPSLAPAHMRVSKRRGFLLSFLLLSLEIGWLRGILKLHVCSRVMAALSAALPLEVLMGEPSVAEALFSLASSTIRSLESASGGATGGPRRGWSRYSAAQSGVELEREAQRRQEERRQAGGQQRAGVRSVVGVEDEPPPETEVEILLGEDVGGAALEADLWRLSMWSPLDREKNPPGVRGMREAIESLQECGSGEESLLNVVAASFSSRPAGLSSSSAFDRGHDGPVALEILYWVSLWFSRALLHSCLSEGMTAASQGSGGRATEEGSSGADGVSSLSSGVSVSSPGLTLRCPLKWSDDQLMEVLLLLCHAHEVAWNVRAGVACALSAERGSAELSPMVGLAISLLSVSGHGLATLLSHGDFRSRLIALCVPTHKSFDNKTWAAVAAAEGAAPPPSAFLEPSSSISPIRQLIRVTTAVMETADRPVLTGTPPAVVRLTMQVPLEEADVRGVACGGGAAVPFLLQKGGTGAEFHPLLLSASHLINWTSVVADVWVGRQVKSAAGSTLSKTESSMEAEGVAWQGFLSIFEGCLDRCPAETVVSALGPLQSSGLRLLLKSLAHCFLRSLSGLLILRGARAEILSRGGGAPLGGVEGLEAGEEEMRLETAVKRAANALIALLWSSAFDEIGARGGGGLKAREALECPSLTSAVILSAKGPAASWGHFDPSPSTQPGVAGFADPVWSSRGRNLLNLWGLSAQASLPGAMEEIKSLARRLHSNCSLTRIASAFLNRQPDHSDEGRRIPPAEGDNGVGGRGPNVPVQQPEPDMGPPSATEPLPHPPPTADGEVGEWSSQPESEGTGTEALLVRDADQSPMASGVLEPAPIPPPVTQSDRPDDTHEERPERDPPPVPVVPQEVTEEEEKPPTAPSTPPPAVASTPEIENPAGVSSAAAVSTDTAVAAAAAADAAEVDEGEEEEEGNGDHLGLILEAAGCVEYRATFDREEVDFEALLLLEESDLKELGLPLGPRKKLLRAIKQLGDAPPQSPSQSLALSPKLSTALTPSPSPSVPQQQQPESNAGAGGTEEKVKDQAEGTQQSSSACASPATAIRQTIQGEDQNSEVAHGRQVTGRPWAVASTGNAAAAAGPPFASIGVAAGGAGGGLGSSLGNSDGEFVGLGEEGVEGEWEGDVGIDGGGEGGDADADERELMRINAQLERAIEELEFLQRLENREALFRSADDDDDQDNAGGRGGRESDGEGDGEASRYLDGNGSDVTTGTRPTPLLSFSGGDAGSARADSEVLGLHGAEGGRNRNSMSTSGLRGAVPSSSSAAGGGIGGEEPEAARDMALQMVLEGERRRAQESQTGNGAAAQNGVSSSGSEKLTENENENSLEGEQKALARAREELPSSEVACNFLAILFSQPQHLSTRNKILTLLEESKKNGVSCEEFAKRSVDVLNDPATGWPLQIHEDHMYSALYFLFNHAPPV
uniref:SAM domain-containing protein n=1 Tax=Chromera velia CCMP2878 TaxID=1169474 RepID=A0A0G4GZD4_9ALVE|eukprot:Cvel_24036.t1-p1 / transcript=Cvel_24036.t1 / gene=Cvel_24036 / organism=Chromera_velia_CCMP2878 / gene_product=hypothetical protein / transcript_product=hypothetical protein / location=Cvel_scaffold2553:6510-17679(-) / protein_length=2829 / sequence_SO=supercontig / SO=protein_coding / is_pseudo=false